MIIDYIAKPFAKVVYKLTKRAEKQSGYKLRLSNLPLGWMNCTTIFDISHVWKRAGMEAIGVSYFTVGDIENGLSSRFNPNSPYYQAWVGGYVVRFSHPREWTVSDHFSLAASDQKDWLKQFGDPGPLAIPDFTNVQEKGKIKVSGFSGNLYKGGIWSHTDMGRAKRGIIFPILMAGLAYFANKDNPKLRVMAQNFMPKWQEDLPVDSFQKIRLEGYTAIIPISENTQVVLFGNGALFTDRSGKKYDTFSKIEPEILQIIKNVQIIKV